ncbi:hypothetical protein [Anaerotignum sp.]
MFGRKTGFLAAVMMALALFGGCGADGKVDETQARNWYNEMTKNGSLVNDTNPDGYGIYSGGPNWTDSNNTERNTYGMRTDNGTNRDNTLGQDIRNAWDNVKNDVKNMGNDNNHGK